MMKIGNITLKKPFLQAPLSGYSDYAMRKLARDFGCELTFIGVMLAKSAANPRVLRKPVFRPRDDEHPIGAQILGTDSKEMAKAACDLHNVGYDIIDLNFACPAPKVLRRGRGGALIDKPDHTIEIFKTVRDCLDCPLMVKIRIGVDSSNESRDNFWKITHAVIENGADAVAIHGRTVNEKYRANADWKTLAQAKIKFPNATLLGSGDLLKAQNVMEFFKTTKMDAAVIARGAIGNPWIFSRLIKMLNGDPNPPLPDIKEQRRVILEHFELLCELYKPSKAVRYFRKFLANYCRVEPDRKRARSEIVTAKTPEQLLATIDKWYPAD